MYAVIVSSGLWSFQETQKFLMLSYFTCIKRRANKTTLELLKVIFL